MNIEEYKSFITSIDLGYIKLIEMSFTRKGDLPEISTQLQMSVSLGYLSEDPILSKEESMAFHPKLVFTLMDEKNNTIFQLSSFYEIVFTFKNFEQYKTYWDKDDIQKYFKEKQIKKTMWPILRQSILDSLLRVSLPPIALPWEI